MTFVSPKSVHTILSMQLVSKYLEVTSNKQQPLDFDNQVMITIMITIIIIIIIIIIIASEPINEAVVLLTILGNNL